MKSRRREKKVSEEKKETTVNVKKRTEREMWETVFDVMILKIL